MNVSLSFCILATAIFSAIVKCDVYEKCGTNIGNCFALPSYDSDFDTCLLQKVCKYFYFIKIYSNSAISNGIFIKDIPCFILAHYVWLRF